MKLKLATLLNLDDDRPVISDKDLYEHTIVIGASGRGKTTALLNIITLLEHVGTVVILDPSGALAEPSLSLLPGGRYITKRSPIKLNPFARPHLTKSEHAQEVVDVINTTVQAFSSNPDITVKMRRIAAEAVEVLDEGITLKDFSDFLGSWDARNAVFKEKPRPAFWQEYDRDRDYAASQTRMSGDRIADRVAMFTKSKTLKEFIAHNRNDFDLPRIVAQKQHHLFNFSGLGDEATAIIGALVTNQIKSYYLHQAVPKTAPPLFIVIDEVHLFITPDLFKRFLAECRKFNIGCVFSFHALSQLPPALADLMLMSKTKIYLGGSGEDEKKLRDYYKYDIPNLGKHESIIYIDNKGRHCRMYRPPEYDEIKTFNWIKDGWIMI